MATEVSICSNALQMLGEKAINSFADGAETGGLDRAQIAENLWPTVRDSIIQSHTWNCCLKRVQMSPLVETPAFGYTKLYQLPADWLRNYEINGSVATEVDYAVEGKQLLIDESVVKLRYIYKNTDIGSWSPMLVEAAELAMAAKMAYKFTQSTEREQALLNSLNRLLIRARSVDGQDQQPSTFGSFEILTARRTP